MSLILDGVRQETPGLESVCWLDDPKVPRVKDGRSRYPKAVRAVVLHTVHGKAGPLADGPAPPSTRAEKYARYQASTTRDVSWHFTVDTDGTVVESADPGLWTCWHATTVNGWTIGVEMVQEDDGTVYRPQIAATVALVELLCRQYAIDRRVPTRNGAPIAGVVERLTGKDGPWSGVFGHRNQTNNRGKGDPGNHVFLALLAAGFEGVTP